MLEEQLTRGALHKACCVYYSGWINESDAKTPQSRWLAERSAITSAPLRRRLKIEKRVKADAYSFYQNCSDSSYQFATNTLAMLRKRADATPARLKNWVQAQDSVFEFCGYFEGEPSYGPEKDIPAPLLPLQLPKDELLYWRQLREYQIAAANFYAGDWLASEQKFSQIAKQPQHPMQVWGEYLALRSAVRQFSLNSGNPNSPDYAALNKRIQKIIANPALTSIHPLASATGRLLSLRFMPEQRFQVLSEILNDWHKNPHAESHLADWRILANQQLDNDDGKKINLMRQSYEYFDWMRTVQSCHNIMPLDNQQSCEIEKKHALDRWHTAVERNQPEAKAWLVAVLMTADDLDDDVLNAAKQIQNTAPEYLTAQYFLMRYLRTHNQPELARKIADTQLVNLNHTISGRNLFLRERFALSTSLQDASHFLQRSFSMQYNPDTQQIDHASKDSTEVLGEDSAKWLNQRLSINDLLELATLEHLPHSLRSRIAIATWVRADLLDKPDAVNQSINLLEKLEPNLKATITAYRAAASAIERTHVLMVAGVSGKNISPVIRWNSKEKYLYQATNKENGVADMWCTIGESQDIMESHDRFMPELPVLQSSDTMKQANEELGVLKQLGSATGFYGKHMLDYAKRFPADKDNPWLLHVAVASTRGGCIDENNSKLSKQLFQWLHQKYPKNEWAIKTPYWY